MFLITGMDFSTDNYAVIVLDELRRQRDSEEFCDVTLQVAGRTISAHKCVLMSASDYFRTLFRCHFEDRDTNTCLLPNVSYDTAVRVVDFMYTGKITISFENVDEILKAADFLCMKSLKVFCSKVLLASLCDETCLSVKLLVDRYTLTDIAVEVLDFIAPRFGTILQSPEALELPVSTVLSLLREDSLNYVAESCLCTYLLKWINRDKTTRKEFVSQMLGLLEFSYLSSTYIKQTILKDQGIANAINNVPGLQMTIQERLSDDSGGVRSLEDIFICRSRTVKMCEEVRLLFYLPREDRWLNLKENPEPHCWDGLESMVHHQGSLYFLVSKTEDMYGYMHHAQENKHFWRLNLRTKTWDKLGTPEGVRGHCRLVTHINGLYVMDRLGLVEEFDVQELKWRNVGSHGFTEEPSATIYLLPMSVDRQIYVLRAFSAGYSFRYARMSFSLHTYDTVRHTWEALSDIEAEDLDLDDHERLHGYTFTPGFITFKNELGLPRVIYDTTNLTWSSVSRRVMLPSFVKDVWGSVGLRTCVYFVGRMTQDTPMFMFYDHEKCRFKAITPPQIFLSGMLCHVLAPAESMALMTSSSATDDG